MEFLTILLLGAAFLQMRATNLRTSVNLLLVQTLVIVLACLVVVFETGEVHCCFADSCH